jgi:hypothetical protein
MDSMDLVIKINKLKKRINGVHGLSMDSMDSKGLVSTFLYFSVPQAILVESMEYTESKD